MHKQLAFEFAREVELYNDVEKAITIVNSKGLGHAVMYYSDGSIYTTEELVELWNNAGKALHKLNNYIRMNHEGGKELGYCE